MKRLKRVTQMDGVEKKRQMAALVRRVVLYQRLQEMPQMIRMDPCWSSSDLHAAMLPAAKYIWRGRRFL